MQFPLAPDLRPFVLCAFRSAVIPEIRPELRSHNRIVRVSWWWTKNLDLGSGNYQKLPPQKMPDPGALQIEADQGERCISPLCDSIG